MTSPEAPLSSDGQGGLYWERELVVHLKSGVSAAELQAEVGARGIVVHGDSLLATRLGYVRLVLPEDSSEADARQYLLELDRTTSVERHYAYEVDEVPSDPDYTGLWGLKKIGAPVAWEIETGSSEVAVLIADTGMALSHPDLVGNFPVGDPNPHDAFENDHLGWDFIESDSVPQDEHGHGSHVAGTIGAVGDNGLGVVGVNWHVQLVSGRVCGGRSCSTYAVADALLYAAERGVRVVNLSLGGYHPELDFEKEALRAAGDAGVVVVCAAGNDARNTDSSPHYPSSYDFDFLVSVAATDEADGLASFSNYGVSTVHLAAPGTNVQSTTLGESYGSKSGTSMASPHVAGAAALYLAAHPDRTAREVRQAILGSVEILPALQGRTWTGGRLDLARLLDYQPPNRCGDGIVREGESCDDGNDIPWDGCSPTCRWEPKCPVDGGACTSTCGDGMTLPGDSEECDDGNLVDGDGCSSRCETELGYRCSVTDEALPDTWQVPVVFRDFNRSPQNGGVRHPDFERFSGRDRTKGLVGDVLSLGTRLPIYTGLCEEEAISGECPQGPQTTSEGNFESWYRSVDGENHVLSTHLTLERYANDLYVFAPTQLFPVDDFGFAARGQEETHDGHNFGFTTEIRSWFRYQGGERLEFLGDDDLWVFVNGRLALDLGGLHPERKGVLDLSGSMGCESVILEDTGREVSTCRELFIEPGEVYEIALFHAERHTNRSNFNLALRGFLPTTSVCELQPCSDGYVRDGRECVDDDECRSGANDCDPNAACENTDGGYLCHCPPGLVGDGQNCFDRDECSDGSADCPEGAICENLIGTYRCEGGQTTFPPPDVDECALRLDSCDDNATCTNSDGSYTCRCNEGFFGNGFFCDDLDECTSGLQSCDEHAVCSNEIGSFSCACEPGWEGDGFSCDDEDECARETHACDKNARCENTEGSYTCSCALGYLGDGLSCEDVDECALGQHDCGPFAVCSNEGGGFRCDCADGYEGDGYLCSLIPVDPGTGGGAGQGGASSGGGGASPGGTGSSSGGSFDAGSGGTSGNGGESGEGGGGPGTNSGGTASEGGTGSEGDAGAGANGGDGPTDDGVSPAGGESGQGGDLGEGGESSAGASGSGGDSSGGADGSSSGGTGGPDTGSGSGSGGATSEYSCARENPCHAEASCTDTEFGPSCTCRPGFSGDGYDCDDIDECAETAHFCDPNATCQNAWGSHYCNCNPDYYGDGQLCLLVPGYVVEVASSSDHTCALLEGGSVRCWGFNEYGQLGYGDRDTTGDDERADTRGYVSVGGAAVQVETGGAHTCALTIDGRVRCWGRNRHGQLGLPGYDGVGDDELPTDVPFVDVGGRVVQLAGGGEHTCALLDTGAVRCWGLGVDGQLGYGSTSDVGDDETPREAGDVPLGRPATEITAGRDHTCAVVEGGDLMCWGRGAWAPTGYGRTDNVGDDETPASVGAVALGAPAVAVDAGWYHTCAIVEQGQVRSLRCFGLGDTGQLGYSSTQTIGDDEDPSVWGDVRLGFEPHAVSAGLYHTCATNFVGEVTCFGYGLYGRLGYGNEDDIGDDEHPETVGFVSLAGRVRSIATGTEHSCAALDSGDVRCWGSSAYGQLGSGSLEDIGDDEYPDGTTPLLETDVNECLIGTHFCDPVAVCADLEEGYRCTCPPGFEGDGLVCTALDNVVLSIAAGDAHSCAIVTTGERYLAGARSGAVRCWGHGGAGRLGLGSTDHLGDDEAPGDALTVNLGENAVQLALGGAHSCALLESGAVRCWGAGARGQLGIGSTISVGDDESPADAPVVLVGGRVRKLVAGADHTCALLESGSVRCWGEGDAGRLGYGNEFDVGNGDHPAEVGDVPLGGRASDLAAGDYHTCVLIEADETQSGGVRCFGAGANGRLGSQATESIGDDETPDTWPYVDLGGPAVALTAGGSHTCALMSDATLRCFGQGNYGALGYGNVRTIGDDEPAFVGGLLVFEGPVTQVVAGRHHTCVLLGDGSLTSGSSAGSVRCWGYGRTGVLGLGNDLTIGDDERADGASPVDVGGFVFEIAAGGSHTCVRLSSGIKCWGSSAQGQLGYGSVETLGRDQVPADYDVIDLF